MLYAPSPKPPRRRNGKLERISRAWQAGNKAALDGKTLADNPYTVISHRMAWEAGLLGRNYP